MSANKPASATIAKWLRVNGHALGGLTGQDWPALKACAELANLWISSDDEGRHHAAAAFGHAVRAMQPNLWHLAFNAIAHVGDWGHRPQLWHAAGLQPLDYVPRSKFGPQ
jgi:hypothetical protein